VAARVRRPRSRWRKGQRSTNLWSAPGLQAQLV
jgi:hypothetical protein